LKLEEKLGSFSSQKQQHIKFLQNVSEKQQKGQHLAASFLRAKREHPIPFVVIQF
jgi:hypothetical protein